MTLVRDGIGAVGGAGYFDVAAGIAGSALDTTGRGGSGRAGGDNAGRTVEGDEADWSADVGDGRGGLAGEGSGSGLLQAEKGDSGLEIGGNSDSGGPDDTLPDDNVSGGSAEPAGTGKED